MINLFIAGDFRAKNASRIIIGNEMKSLVCKADYAICNFEAPVESNGIPIAKSGPCLDQDSKAPDLLKSMGFNVISLANNHIMDYGQEGCKQTIAAFDGCVCVGAGYPREAFEVKIIEKDGKKIGFLSFSQHEFGVIDSPLEDQGYGAAWIGSLDIEDVIRDAKNRVDFLLILPHAGVEHIDAPLPKWRLFYKKLIRWGADLVVASHPHCPQGFEFFENKYIFYSLGNFYFDELSEGEFWFKGLALEVSIDDIINVKIHHTVFDKDGNLSIDCSKESKVHFQKVTSLLEDQEKYDTYINKVCIDHYEGMKYGLLRGIGGYSIHLRFYYALRLLVLMLLGNKNEMYLLNTLQNESHRWLIEHYLNFKRK